MSNLDIEGVIEDSVNDSVAPEETTPDVDTSSDVSLDTSAETIDTSVDSPIESSSEVASPGARTDQSDGVADEFAKKFGLASQSVTGRENRIPYSRVKKIVERAEKEATARATKELEGKSTPQLTELTTKVKDYEERLGRVSQFENILENDPRQFLSMLSQVPAYKEFFDYISQVGSGNPAQQPKGTLDAASMPQPDQTLSDGSKVYSMEGLSARDEWLARQIEDRAVSQAEARLSKRYAPIEAEWQSQQRIAQAVPVIQKQIDDARTWPQFVDNENAIVAALRADQNLSLEAAYRTVVYPKIQGNRDDMRKSILAELKKTPMNSAAPTSASRPGQVPGAPRSLEDIISEAAQTLK